MVFEDEVWWSRLAQPGLSAWTAGAPLRLVQKEAAKGDAEPPALACYGALLADAGRAGERGRMLLRFVDGRPVSAVTTPFLGWLAGALAAEGKGVAVLVWDNASWHISKEVRGWLRAHNRRVKKSQGRGEGGCRLLACYLPSKSPWLNAIEPGGSTASGRSSSPPAR